MSLTTLNPNLLGTDSAGASKLSSAGGLVQLHSTGQFTIANTSANNISIANTGAVTLTTNTFTVGTAMYSIANGNVGIGTASANSTLTVAGTSYISGNTTIAGNSVIVASNTALTLPVGTTAQRPTGVSGMMRFNANNAAPEYYNGSAWVSLGTLDGSSPGLAAPSAAAIYNLGVRTSGLYWLKPAGWSYPAQFYCEMNLHGGGWIYLLQRQCYSTGTSNSSLPGSYLTGQSGTPNHASSNFYGVVDQNGGTKTPQDIWNAFVGSSTAGKMYAREIQTSNGSYDESQRYVSSTDGALFSWSEFTRFFSGNYSNGTWQAGAVRVYYNNGGSYVDGKTGETWSAPSLACIHSGGYDNNIYFGNGTDNYDSNWGFGLMQGGNGFPATAGSGDGGARRTNNITRWGIIGIKA